MCEITCVLNKLVKSLVITVCLKSQLVNIATVPFSFSIKIQKRKNIKWQQQSVKNIIMKLYMWTADKEVNN